MQNAPVSIKTVVFRYSIVTGMRTSSMNIHGAF